MTKRNKIALALWYERQPPEKAAIWNTEHPKWPLWLQLCLAGYMSWKHMGGTERWHRKIFHWAMFWFTVVFFRLLKKG